MSKYLDHNPPPEYCKLCGVRNFSYDRGKGEFITFPNRGKLCQQCIDTKAEFRQLAIFEQNTNNA